MKPDPHCSRGRKAHFEASDQPEDGGRHVSAGEGRARDAGHHVLDFPAQARSEADEFVRSRSPADGLFQQLEGVRQALQQRAPGPGQEQQPVQAGRCRDGFVEGGKVCQHGSIGAVRCPRRRWRRVVGGHLERASQAAELVDQDIAVHRGIAVEDRHDAVVAQQLLEDAVGVLLRQHPPGSEQMGRTFDDLVPERGDERLGNSRHDAHLAWQNMRVPGGDVADDLGCHQVGEQETELGPDRRQIHQGVVVDPTGTGEAQHQTQRLVACTER